METVNRKKSAKGSLTDRNIMKHFPKIELHRHLEGTFSVPDLFILSRKNGLPMPADLEDFMREVRFPKDSTPDFLTFLSKFKNDWYRSLEDVSFIVYESIKHIIEDGIFYIELRFSPEHFALHNSFDRNTITRLVIEQGNRAARETGLRIKYLLTFNRSKQTEEEMISLYDNLKTLDLPDIIGIDLAGDELNYPAKLFQNFFKHIRKDDRYKFTIHAGEVTPPSEIWDAIRLLDADRIGHGTSAINDPELQDYLKEHRIALEQCITSNYQTGSWIEEENHPLGNLYRLGVPVTINSDDPSIQDTDLTEDYIKAVHYFALSVDDLVGLNLNAIEATFLPEPEKSVLRKDYLHAVENFKKRYLL